MSFVGGVNGGVGSVGGIIIVVVFVGVVVEVNGGETDVVFLDDGWVQTVEVQKQDELVVKACHCCVC